MEFYRIVQITITCFSQRGHANWLGRGDLLWATRYTDFILYTHIAE